MKTITFILFLLLICLKGNSQEGLKFDAKATLEYIQKLFDNGSVKVEATKYMNEEQAYPDYFYIDSLNIMIKSWGYNSGRVYYYSFNENDISIRQEDNYKSKVYITCRGSDCIQKRLERYSDGKAYLTPVVFQTQLKLIFPSETIANRFIKSFEHLQTLLISDPKRERVKDPFD